MSGAKHVFISGVTALGLALTLASRAGAQVIPGFADSYAGDSGIQLDSRVIFSEMFEEASLPALKANWQDTSKVPANIQFDASVPAGSPGHQSLRLVTVNDADTTGVTPNENTYLYRRILPAIADSVFVRFYIRYDTTTRYHHSGVWVGGKNPPLGYPAVQAGAKPAGNGTFHVGAEVRGTTLAPAKTALFGFYNYWMGMHASTQLDTAGNPYYWGNQFPNSVTADDIGMNAWNCVELRIKLNNPVSSSTGELTLWINGVRVTHLGPGFPTGSWGGSGGDFIEGAGAPFPGFQWRDNDSLKFNYLWLTNYATNNVSHTGSVYYDHVVVAKNYIGPLKASGTGVARADRHLAPRSLHPGPSGLVVLQGLVKEGAVIEPDGRTRLRFMDTDRFSATDLAPGVYLVRADGNSVKLLVGP